MVVIIRTICCIVCFCGVQNRKERKEEAKSWTQKEKNGMLVSYFQTFEPCVDPFTSVRSLPRPIPSHTPQYVIMLD